jgi:hypothetical protein
VCSVDEFLQDIGAEFPTLEPSRYQFSFANGAYDAKVDKFYEYGKDALPEGFVSLSYIEQNMVTGDNSTPHFDSILNSQNTDDEEGSAWMYSRP